MKFQLRRELASLVNVLRSSCHELCEATLVNVSHRKSATLTFERCGRTLETNGTVCFASFGCQMNAWRLFEPNDGAMRR
ncbi:MAG: hypothetical protein ACTS43_00700 [Candidatus Hodgkinia cicadicola]